jgi:hypothetical protein
MYSITYEKYRLSQKDSVHRCCTRQSLFAISIMVYVTCGTYGNPPTVPQAMSCNCFIVVTFPLRMMYFYPLLV